MSREVLDEYIDKINEEEHDIGVIIEELVEYGFVDEHALCKVFEMDTTELDELVSSSDKFSDKQIIKYNALLVRHLKKLKKSYERLYLRQSD